jgi:DNA-binding NtrC family response regulator
MRQRTELLWVRTATPGPEEIELLESLEQFTVRVAHTVNDAFDRLRSNGADVVLAELPVAGLEPVELLEAIQEIDSRVPVLIHDPSGTVADSVRLVKLGAYHFTSGALNHGELAGILEMAAEKSRLRKSAFAGDATEGEPWKRFLIGESRAMREVEQIIRLAGPRRSTVLVEGETGTGKEVVARALHLASPRAQLPMVAVNCSALPANLLEAELFGHVRGAFTGAHQHRVGRFEQAHNTTLFLDEIGDMPLELQAKLLRVLQEREFQRIGSSETIRVDVRIVAASNAGLRDKVSQGLFREDLFYRLNVVPISVPPLRERISDIPLLVHHFLEKVCRAEGVPVKRISRETVDRLCVYPWPGNVRQLENKVERAVVLSESRLDLNPADFPLSADSPRKTANAVTAPAVLPEGGMDFDLAVSTFQRTILEQAIEKSGGNKTLAADLLRMKRTTLLAKLRTLETRGNVVTLKSA